MKKTFLFALILCLTLFACVKERVKSYYLISYKPPIVHERYGRFEASEPSLDIQNLKKYESDSVAIETETERMIQYLDGLPESCEKEIKKIEAKHKSPEFQDELIRTTREVYDDLAKSLFTILILTHDSDFEASELLSIVEKEGGTSPKVDTYCKEHNVEIRFVSLN